MPQPPDAAVAAQESHEPIGDRPLEVMAEAAVLPAPRSWPRVAAWVALVALVAAGVVAVVAEHRSNLRSGLPRIDVDHADRVQSSLAQWEKQERAERAVAISGALARLEQGRIPEALRGALRRIGEVPSHRRRAVLAEALRDPAVAAIWHDTCPNGAAIFEETIGMAPTSTGMHVYRRCELHRFELLPPDKVLATEAVDVMLAHMLWDYLRRRRALTDVEAAALRLLSTGGVEPARAWPHAPR